MQIPEGWPGQKFLGHLRFLEKFTVHFGSYLPVIDFSFNLCIDQDQSKSVSRDVVAELKSQRHDRIRRA